MTYYGKLLSNDLLLHAIRTSKPALTDAQGKPLTLITLKRKADGSLRHNGDYLRHQRREMFKRQKGMCYYCREMMVLVERSGINQKRNGKQARNEATIEHLDPRYSPERGKHPGKTRRVLACMGCNCGRSARDIAAMPIQTKWALSWATFVDIAKRSGALNEVVA